ncbi:hypothetical protein C2845_PM01G03780 [Panicum miliaceum]|uniref:RNA helicase n=1 Tax=Panicum miliaceum TaxID=4540 RepID=A0A3L6TLF2_PANMI|nr:hypothetical protein C2845_PM01G03780 [Panicum miliaceum]
MGTYLRNYSDDEFSVAGEKPEVEFMDYQNDDTIQDYASEDGPVVVTVPFPFEDGKPKSVLVGETSADTISIENTSPEPVNLWSVRIFSSNPEDSYVLSMMRPPLNDADEEAKQAFLGLTSVEDRTLMPGQTLTIWLSCMPKDIGLHTSIVHVDIDIRELIESKQRPDVLSEELSMINYAQFFSTLLVMEELNLEEEMRAYDMEGVSMRRRGMNFLSLEVPGSAERRPSLVQGDFIVARYARNDARPYQGFIHKVEADEIFLKFDDQFHFNHHDRNQHHVSFTYNRVNMRRLYKSIHEAELLGPGILFPCQSPCRAVKRCPFKPLNPHINTEQADAVAMILGCRGVPPYVIYGPPGTGKTMTIIEAILQLYTAKKTATILICAASNAAADHVLEKLLLASYLIRPSDIFRLNAPSRQYEDVNADFIRFCFFEDRVFKCPPSQALMQYKIVISTYMSSSLLQAEGISHTFSWMRLQADKEGLGISYLQRLFFDFEQYRTGNPNYVTKLVRNYRCRPAILELPSELFYGGELIACKEDEQVAKIKKALEAFEMSDLKVRSVEQFLGQEREVIIISTVRSTVKHNEFDKFFNLGFLSNYQRFNVAITRAKSLLIIVGNPHIVTKDRHWDRLLRYCADNDETKYNEDQGGPAGWGYNQEEEEATNYNYNQESSDFGLRRGSGAQSAATKNGTEWSEELPEDENLASNNAEVDPEEMPEQHVEERVEQGDVQANECLTSDDQVHDACPEKFTFPPGWCDVSAIPASGWDD